MIYVYVIKSEVKKFRYVGITKDIEKRVHEHNLGKNKPTKPYKPFRIVHQELFNDYKMARNREIFLKSGQGRLFLDSI